MRAGSAARLACRRELLGQRDRHQFLLDRHRNRQSRPRSRLSGFSAAADRGRHRLVPRHHQAPANSGRARAGAFGCRARTQEGPGREISLAHPANSGVGYWVEPVPIVPGPTFTIGDSGDVIASFQHLLAEYGYRVPVDGEFDEIDARCGDGLPAAFPARARGRRGRFLDIDDAAGAARFPRAATRRRRALRSRAKTCSGLDADAFSPHPFARQSAGRPLSQCSKGCEGGKSGLHGQTVPDNVRRGLSSRKGTAQGQCHREANRRGALRFSAVRVKRCGKSAPRLRQRRRHGKPHREQNRIGMARGFKPQVLSGPAIRVGCFRRRATGVAEEWPSRASRSRDAPYRTRLIGLLA